MPISLNAKVERIKSTHLNVAQSSSIYIKPGLISVLELPQSIIEVRIGNPNELKAVISQVSPHELTLYFKNSKVSATNLIIRSDRKMYVFDIIPSNLKHQDYVKVSGGYGSPSYTNQLRLQESSLISPNRAAPKFNKLKLDESESISL